MADSFTFAHLMCISNDFEISLGDGHIVVTRITKRGHPVQAQDHKEAHGKQDSTSGDVRNDAPVHCGDDPRNGTD